MRAEPDLSHEAAEDDHGEAPAVSVDEPAEQVGRGEDSQPGGRQRDAVGHHSVLVEVAADHGH